VTGRVEQDPDTVDLDRLTKGNRCNRGVLVKLRARGAQLVTGHEVVAASAAEMVRMSVRHHRAVDGPPGIDKEVAPLTVQAEVGRFEEWDFVAQ